MRSFGRVLACALLVVAMPPGPADAQPQALYREATAREAVLRQALDATRADDAPAPLLTRIRTLVTTFEDIARLTPASGYSDNALWQGALLSADAYWQFGDAIDRATALRLFSALSARFPTSSLVKQIPTQVKRLERSRVPARASTAPHREPPQSQAPSSAPRQPAPSTGAQAPTGHAAVLKAIRREVLPDAVRVTLELERETAYREERLEGPSRVFIDLHNTRTVDSLRDATLSFPDGAVRHIRIGRQSGTRTRVVLDLEGVERYSVYALYDPYRLVIDFDRRASTKLASLPRNAPGATWPAAPATGSTPKPEGLPTPPPAAVSPAPPSASGATAPAERDSAPAADGAGPSASAPVAPPAAAPAPSAPSANAAGGFSLSRQLGLGVARIVIDAGHGGHDPGAKVRGLTEADLVLDVALRLERLLTKQPGVEVMLTRRGNTFVPLEERTAMANRAGADLFLSIHANASGNASAHGVETYFLNFAPNPAAEAIAARENAGSSKTMSHLPDIVRAIALNNKIDESRDFAGMVQSALYERLRKTNKEVRNLGVKQAPFMVLIGATMPSILAEISFLTNGREASLLRTEAYRQQIAEALLAGVMQYQQSLKRLPTIAGH